MTDFEQYKEHIECTFNAYCKIVIRHAAIDESRRLRSTWEREIYFEYLTAEKFYPFSTEDVYFAEPEERPEYPVFISGQTVMLDNPQLAAALPRLPEQWQDMLYLRFHEYYTYQKPEAVEAVLSHYAGYIKYVSSMNGRVNADVEEHVKQKLIES